MLINESQIIIDNIDINDVEEINEKEEVSCLCCFCGKTLSQIRQKTFKEEQELGEITRSVISKHWLGMGIKGFCILHCNQRCFERILYHFGKNDECKINLIVQTFISFKLVREGWKFKKKGMKLYPKMLKGTEVLAICMNFQCGKDVSIG